MNTLTIPKINVCETAGHTLGLMGVVFLSRLTQAKDNGRKLDIMYSIEEAMFTVHVDTILTTLDEAPDHETWDKMHTIWEKMDVQGMDYLEVKIA